MIRIPILDLSYEINELKPQLMKAFERVIDNGVFIMGPNVKQFEAEAAAYLGVKHAVALNSGTDALVIALLAAGIKEGDEVITTPFTFFATAEAISQVKAIPVFADVERDTFNIDIDRLEAAITPKTKAIIPVHLFGQSADMDRLMSIAEKHGVIVVEDVAQAFGGGYKNKKTGTIGDIGCYSFFPSKNLGAYGDGGLLVTNHSEFAEKAAMLRVHGSKKKYYNEVVGFNSRLDELQAAILRIKLPRIDEWNEGRRNAAERYAQLLADVDGVVVPDVRDYAKHVFHQYTIRVTNGKRDELQRKLEEAGVSTMIYYPVPVHKLPIYESLRVHMPVAEQLAGEVLSLPIWPQIEPSVQQYVVEKIIEALQ